MPKKTKPTGNLVDDCAVLAIKAFDMTGTGLAQLYGVTPANISAVRNHKTWRHI